MLSKEAILAYPDFNKEFHLYASDFQLGATLMQDGKTLGYYTRKLNKSQRNYTVGEKELLSVFEGLKAFDGVVRGTKIIVHTDHLNLLYDGNPSQRMKRWRMLIEEYHPTFVHVKGKNNDAADALSRLDMLPNKIDEIDWEPPHKRMKYSDHLCVMFNLSNFEDGPLDNRLYPASISDEKSTEIIREKYWDCAFALGVNMFKAHQAKDKKLLHRVKLAKTKAVSLFSTKEVEGVELIHYNNCLLYTSPSPRDKRQSRMPSSA